MTCVMAEQLHKENLGVDLSGVKQAAAGAGLWSSVHVLSGVRSHVLPPDR